MKNSCWLPSVLCLVFVASASLQSFSQDESFALDQFPAVPAQIVGSIYADAASSPSIESVASWGSYLYLSVRYVNGDQKLEVWDVRDPSAPVMVDSKDYGNLMAEPRDHWKFPSVNVFDDRVVVRSNFSDTIYYRGEGGQLVTSATNDFADSVGGIINNEESMTMSSAESYGTFFGRLYDPYEVLPQEEYGHLILNFTNPNRPFVSTLVPPKNPEVMVQEFGGHITGSLGNQPAVVKTTGNQISISARKIKADSNIDVFWEPRLPRIFNADAFDRTVRSQIDRIVNAQPLTDLLTEAVDRFFDELDIPEGRTVVEAIEADFDLNADLSDLLDDYEIDLDISVRAAVQKVIERHLSIELEKQLSIDFFSPLVSDWMDELFAIPTDLSPAEMKDSISLIINDGLNAETVARYILDKYIAPYVDVPDWMYWTMDDLVDKIVNSTGGEIVTAAVSLVDNTINAGNWFEVALAFIPDADEFYIPAGFPEDCRDVLEYAFFEHGAKLNRNGLAFMEMLKFYQYYQGNDGYIEYEIELSESVRDLQEQLSSAFVETVEPFLATLTYLGDMQERLESFTEEISCRAGVSLAIRDAILIRLEERGVDVDLSVRDALQEYNLYADIMDVAVNPNARLSDVEDFVNVLLDDLQEGQTAVRTLWSEGVAHVGHFEDLCRKVLSEMLREAWGDIDLDLDVHTAIREFIGNHIDYRWTFGANMDGLFQRFVNSCLSEYPPFLDDLPLYERAVDGDVIARWQITFQMAAAIAAYDPLTIEESIKLEAIELAIDEFYKNAMANIVKMLLLNFAGILADDMFGSFSTWATQTDAVNYTYDVQDFVSLNPVRSESFVWKDRGIVVARESWDYMNPRRISLALFDPLNPIEDVREVMLDGWGNVDYIHFHRGNILIGGSMYDGFLIKTVGQLLTVEEDRIVSNKLYDLGISSAEGMLGVNRDAHLVFYGPKGVYLVSNPRTTAPSNEKPDTAVGAWMCY